MYLNREEGSGKGKALFCGEHLDSLEVLSANPLTRFHLSEVTLKVGWCCAPRRRRRHRRRAWKSVSCHYVMSVQLIARREDAGHYPPLCLFLPSGAADAWL